MASARLAPEAERGADSALTRRGDAAPPPAGVSYTKLYMQWQEAQEECRALQRAARRNEHDIDQVTLLLERKQVEVQAQNEEFGNLRHAYARMEVQLAAHADEKRALEGRAAQAGAAVRALEGRLAVAERECCDRGRQVAALADENSRLKGQPVARGAARYPDNAAGADVDAQTLISEALTEFADLDGCLKQNALLLRALRSVSAEADANRDMAAEEVERRLGDEARVQGGGTGVGRSGREGVGLKE